jgi:hypothetical protein
MPHPAFHLGELVLACGFLALPVSASPLNYTYTVLGQVATIDDPHIDVSDITRVACGAPGANHSYQSPYGLFGRERRSL